MCPTCMLGKYDSKPGSGAMIVSLHSQKLPGYSRGGRNYVYAGDVAVSVVNAIEFGRIGEAYILGNQNMNYKTAFNLIAKTIGVLPPRIGLPGSVVLLYGVICTCINKLTKKTVPNNIPMAKIANEGFYYDCSKAINELKLPQTPIEIAIRECFLWLKQEGLLQNNKS